MGACNPASGPNPGIIGECSPTFIGCVPVTDGQPIVVPEEDQLPIHVDPNTGCIWLYVCDNIGWFSVCPNSLCDLTPVDVGVINNLCENLNIPVTYSVEGVCVEGTITLQNLATEIANCLPAVDDCCYEPVLLDGDVAKGHCFRVDGVTNGPTRLVDSLTSEFDIVGGNGPLIIEWTVTNTTNQPAILTNHMTAFADRFDFVGHPGANVETKVLMMMGVRDDVYSYTLDNTQQGDQTQSPHFDDNVSYDIRDMSLNEVYSFFGNWLNTLCPTCDPALGVNVDMVHELMLNPGETVNMAARIAWGYAAEVGGGPIPTDAGWFGANIKWFLKGHNEIV